MEVSSRLALNHLVPNSRCPLHLRRRRLRLHLNADVVGLYKIFKNVTEPESARYDFKTVPVQLFKTSPKEIQPLVGKKVIITTEKHAIACGLSGIKFGQTQLLTGYYNSNKHVIVVSICNQVSVLNWDKVPVDVKDPSSMEATILGLLPTSSRN
ncbi:hypothetical protein L596_028546 [Steinernema carpocapsae]|uniref:Uncharacterized protein n=1 Tax=Steinernema carpocapsae TaxID=34508 RepID=A0A4U5LYS8_STECR|nr:hypothetical protein L596_028546 [Steinernema carpocapsae]